MDKAKLTLMKQRVFEANEQLPANGLVKLTWGNASEIDRDMGVIVIKPSGVNYQQMKVEDMVVTDLKGNVIEGDLRPSSDLPTHVVLYQNFPEIGGIVHTHSTNGAAWAQTGRAIPTYGTTHADSFYGAIPCTRNLTAEEVTEAYEYHTGEVIVETFNSQHIESLATPGVIVYGHGPFTWGVTVEKAVENSVILEEVAKIAWKTETIDSSVQVLPQYLSDKHYYRKHGKNAYYGQK